MQTEIWIISLGGSLICPQGQPDTVFLEGFRRVLRGWYTADPRRRAVVIAGGGGPARIYQAAARELHPDVPDQDLDWIGIRATHLNAELVRSAFGTEAPDPVVTDPTVPLEFRGRVLVAAGWKPGFSTDFDAVLLADRFGARRLLNLSNVTKVFTADPKTDPSAQPLDELTWEEFQRLVGREWKPGANLPFDPVATSRARELGLWVVIAGPSLENLSRILNDEPFEGTVIRPASV